MTTFGAAWTSALIEGAASLGIPPAWVLAVLALESGFNPAARNKASLAFGLWQRMPPYAETDPTQQLRDAFAFWRAQVCTFEVSMISSRAVFYCLNLAPARTKGTPTDETVLYSSRQDLHPREFWPKGYAQNRNLDAAGRGWIVIGDLEPSLARAVRACQARYDAELAAAASPAIFLGSDDQPDMRDGQLSEVGFGESQGGGDS